MHCEQSQSGGRVSLGLGAAVAVVGSREGGGECGSAAPLQRTVVLYQPALLQLRCTTRRVIYLRAAGAAAKSNCQSP